MDTFELTKIAGPVLAALLLMFAPKTLAELAGGHGGGNEELAGYALPQPKPQAAAVTGAAGSAAPAAVAAFDPANIVKLLATAKPEAGEAAYKRCVTCHANDKSAKSGAGPNLWNVVGRKKGGRDDFGAYSEALKAKGGEWTYADLAAFLHNSKEWMPGTKMNIAVSDPAELADLVSYLRTLADSPAPLPQ